MKKSIIGPDFEKKDAVPPYKESKHALKLKHRVSLKSQRVIELLGVLERKGARPSKLCNCVLDGKVA